MIVLNADEKRLLSDLQSRGGEAGNPGLRPTSIFKILAILFVNSK